MHKYKRYFLQLYVTGGNAGIYPGIFLCILFCWFIV